MDNGIHKPLITYAQNVNKIKSYACSLWYSLCFNMLMSLRHDEVLCASTCLCPYDMTKFCVLQHAYVLMTWRSFVCFNMLMSLQHVKVLYTSTCLWPYKMSKLCMLQYANGIVTCQSFVYFNIMMSSRHDDVLYTPVLSTSVDLTPTSLPHRSVLFLFRYEYVVFRTCPWKQNIKHFLFWWRGETDFCVKDDQITFSGKLWPLENNCEQL